MTLMTHIIATKPPRSPQIVVKSKGNPFISGKSKLVKYYNLARYICLLYIYIYTLELFVLELGQEQQQHLAAALFE